MKQNEPMKSVILLALAVVLIGGGLVYWQWGNRSAAEARVAAVQQKMPDEQQLQNDLTKSQTDLEGYKSRLEHLEKSLPTVAYVPTLLKELETLGKESNIAVTGVRPIAPTVIDGEDEAKPYKELEIDITGQGSYRAVMTMVASLRTFPKVLAVKTVNLQPRQDLQSKTNELDATVRLKAYMFKSEDESGAEAEGGKSTKQASNSLAPRRPAL